MPEHADRHFAAKVRCFNAGYGKIRTLEFDIIGNVDADISFDQDYMEYLLDKFAQYPGLGVAGTPYLQDSSSSYDYRFTNIEHVSGACQLFRRSCFEAIGGYMPIRGGGIDWVAVTTARMKGWKTRTFTGKTVFHYRKMGTEKSNVLGAGYRLGKKDYCLGNHPLWEFFRIFYQMKFRPFILGGVALFLGYSVAAIGRKERPVPPELMKFSRQEQMKRLKAKLLFER
jgi:GT2 family glycosyltransferase